VIPGGHCLQIGVTPAPIALVIAGPARASIERSYADTSARNGRGASAERAGPATNPFLPRRAVAVLRRSYHPVMSDIAGALAAASAFLTEHPDEARYRDSHASARLADGLHVEVTGPGGEHVSTDMPRAIGGAASVPSPGWYLRAAAASCVASLIGIRAAALGLELPRNGVEVTVDSESDDRGILGLDPAVPAGALSMKVVAAQRGGSIDPATFEEIVQWAVEHCPVTDTVRRAVPMEVESR
jgi:uncharacterized OsmC-like protein